MNKKKSKRGDYDIEDLGDVDLGPELDEKTDRLSAAADEELDSTRVNFRWHREPLGLIKAVADAMGIPYQTYMKQVLYRQALDDFAKIQANQLARGGKRQASDGKRGKTP